MEGDPERAKSLPAPPKSKFNVNKDSTTHSSKKSIPDSIDISPGEDRIEDVEETRNRPRFVTRNAGSTPYVWNNARSRSFLFPRNVEPEPAGSNMGRFRTRTEAEENRNRAETRQRSPPEPQPQRKDKKSALYDFLCLGNCFTNQDMTRRRTNDRSDIPPKRSPGPQPDEPGPTVPNTRTERDNPSTQDESASGSSQWLPRRIFRRRRKVDPVSPVATGTPSATRGSSDFTSTFEEFPEEEEVQVGEHSLTMIF